MDAIGLPLYLYIGDNPYFILISLHPHISFSNITSFMAGMVYDIKLLYVVKHTVWLKKQKTLIAQKATYRTRNK